MQAQTEPQTRRCRSSSYFTCAGSMCDGSSTGISTVSKPHFLKVLKRVVLSVVNGEVKRNVLMPILIDGRRVEREAKKGKPKRQRFPPSKSSRIEPLNRAADSPSRLNGERAGVRGEAVRLAQLRQRFMGRTAAV